MAPAPGAGGTGAVSERVIRTPAKINLCLSVLGRRPDGYHDVEMLMQAVGLFDEVRVRLAPAGITVFCDDPSVPSGEGNIAFRAAKEALSLAGARSGVAVEIRKAIPSGAGLGGGSSDAAAVLAACSDLLGLKLSPDRLAELGTRLGMDVPFFFSGPTAIARGRGEVLEPLAPPAPYWVLLVNPGFAVPTAWVYQNLNLGLTRKVDCTNIARLSVRRLAGALHNDLETVTASHHPVICEMEEALMGAGALGSRMSGSGPTVFGLFETEEACRSAASALDGRGWRLFPAQALTESPFGRR
jgi:4-diphosphocytidyl-2-C-methyl-D-erythritol kinase